MVLENSEERSCCVDSAANMNRSPTVSCDFEYLYFQAKANCSDLDVESYQSGSVESGIDCNNARFLANTRDPIQQTQKIKSKEKSKQSILRLVDGRLQIVGFSAAKPKTNIWRDVVDSMFR